VKVRCSGLRSRRILARIGQTLRIWVDGWVAILTNEGPLVRRLDVRIKSEERRCLAIHWRQRIETAGGEWRRRELALGTVS